MKLKEKTLVFKIAIATNRLFNVFTGGSFHECFSTRAHIRSQIAKPRYVRNNWIKVVKIIDRMFWDGHCEDSFLWEMRVKGQYVKLHNHLITRSVHRGNYE